MKRFFQRLHMVLVACLEYLKVTWQITRGVWELSELPGPMVTIFGGSKLTQDNPFAQQAMLLAEKLVSKNISVITGGGPGIMQAANCGAVYDGKRKPLRSIGVGVTGLGQEEINKCAQETIIVDYFFARKWLMTQYSVAFIFFPGGFGTLDEMMEVTTQMQTKIMRQIPIILYGTAYWKPLMGWVDTALSHGLLKDKDRDLLMVTTDNIDEIVQLVEEAVRKLKPIITGQ